MILEQKIAVEAIEIQSPKEAIHENAISIAGQHICSYATALANLSI